MRFIVYGVGAIGGTVAGNLVLSGQEVIGIARGSQLQALRDNGLLLRTPAGAHRVTFPCVSDPTEIDIRADDVIMLTMKGQDTEAALQRLIAAGVTDQPIICAQNGVANERAVLRFFPNVYGIMVMLPATYVVAGEVAAFGSPHPGVFDIGRYPKGVDVNVTAVCAALEKANFGMFPHENVMESKSAKLVQNLANVLDVVIAKGSRQSPIATALRAEGEAVLQAAGVTYGAIGEDDPRRGALVKSLPVEGADRVGSSSLQSIARGAGSIETDYLNGEIVLLGALHGVPTPINSWLCHEARRVVVEKLAPGGISVADAEKALAAYL